MNKAPWQSWAGERLEGGESSLRSGRSLCAVLGPGTYGIVYIIVNIRN